MADSILSLGALLWLCQTLRRVGATHLKWVLNSGGMLRMRSILFCISVSPCARAVYVRPPLMDEGACLVRKMFIFGVVEKCKLLWGMGLENFGFLQRSRIVPTHSMRF